jgi:hypothetical protein
VLDEMIGLGLAGVRPEHGLRDAWYADLPKV